MFFIVDETKLGVIKASLWRERSHKIMQQYMKKLFQTNIEACLNTDTRGSVVKAGVD